MHCIKLIFNCYLKGSCLRQITNFYGKFWYTKLKNRLINLNIKKKTIEKKYYIAANFYKFQPRSTVTPQSTDLIYAMKCNVLKISSLNPPPDSPVDVTHFI